MGLVEYVRVEGDKGSRDMVREGGLKGGDLVKWLGSVDEFGG